MSTVSRMVSFICGVRARVLRHVLPWHCRNFACFSPADYGFQQGLDDSVRQMNGPESSTQTGSIDKCGWPVGDVFGRSACSLCLVFHELHVFVRVPRHNKPRRSTHGKPNRFSTTSWPVCSPGTGRFQWANKLAAAIPSQTTSTSRLTPS
jgi:hypothetical protein